MRRLALVVLAAALAAACTDVRGFAGTWRGVRSGRDPVVTAGFQPNTVVTLDLAHVSLTELAGHLTSSDGRIDAEVRPLGGAEADVLSTVTFDGAPLRVFLAFVAVGDGGGDALLVLALFDDDRIEARLLRGGPTPLYGIFPLARS